MKFNKQAAIVAFCIPQAIFWLLVTAFTAGGYHLELSTVGYAVLVSLSFAIVFGVLEAK